MSNISSNSSTDSNSGSSLRYDCTHGVRAYQFEPDVAQREDVVDVSHHQEKVNEKEKYKGLIIIIIDNNAIHDIYNIIIHYIY